MGLVYRVHNYSSYYSLPSQHLDPALPTLFWFTPAFPTCPTVAQLFWDIKRTYPEEKVIWMWPISPLLQSVSLQHLLLTLIVPPSQVVCDFSVMYGRASPQGISVEVDSSYQSKPLPKQTVQASSKAYGFLDVNDDWYLYIWILYISSNEVPHEWIYRNPNPPNHSCYDLLHPRSSRSFIWLMFFI